MSVVAELCQNHNGDLAFLKTLVERAGQAGATYVKIQSFFAEDLTPEWRERDGERVKRLELSWEAHALFVQWCKQAGVIPMTSVYKMGYLEKLWAAGFRHVKIGSAQAMNKELVEGYVKLGFKVVLSTGGHALGEIPKVHPLAGVLHCVSKYPCPANEANLSRMLQISKYWPSVPYGFSSHLDPTDSATLDTLKLASFLGANLIEVHFTLLPRDQTKDGPVSLYLGQLADLCRFHRLSAYEKRKERPEWGSLVCPPDDSEKALIARYESRWVNDAE